ncbi:MAG: alanine--tRNA ligase [Nanoarchaeota archaeon]|nr:alanine--tRNA ligase [Nanoarchaeota archaeon]MBU1135184.1 alanine--tRNA ligase [Nanoarchaeota archaeon]MBU2519952.1 alanine--tRNA ligase [Nanoarchaeota archaeon]
MLRKEELKKKFSANTNKYYNVGLFKEKGFVRKKCSCGKHFWTLDNDRKTCEDSSCENYSFIGKPVTKGKWNYVEMWNLFEKFFKKNGHASIKRYPVIDRWRPDLFFTIASIQNFQRIDKGKMVMEYPSDPLIVPQVCLRFSDIVNVGVTGRHHTSFMMPGQHSFGNYWKDRCIELNFEFLTKSMGIPEKELTYIEDVWSMPDFSQFGPSLETMHRGLELVNSVFSQFTKKGNSYKELSQKVVDVGWGHERLLWISHGTSTGYDAVFGPVIEWMKKQTGFHDDDLFKRYSLIAGNLNYDEVSNIKKAKEQIAEKLGVSTKELANVVEPIQALYAVADHTKSLLFAVSDGGIPSNVGGGYNLRVILRRALSFLDQYSFDFDLGDVSSKHVKHLKKMFPELGEGLEPLMKILDIEKEKYSSTMNRAHSMIQKELESGKKLDRDYLTQLYVSNGITPELVEKVAKEKNIDFQTPEDFYVSITSKHMKEEKEEQFKFDVSMIKPTEPLYYQDSYKREFDAKVLKIFSDKEHRWAVLDKTLFYAEGGGQPGDKGILEIGDKKIEILDTQKKEGVILHKTNSKDVKEGQKVHGIIDWNHRYQLMKMHTTTHLVAGAVRSVIGPHIWQAGAKKDIKKSRIDLTHYLPFTQKEIELIERKVNDAIKDKMKVNVQTLPRGMAEQKYGFVLYQGGASPGKEIRVVKVGDNGFDVEACSGTHVKNAEEIEKIKIIRHERVQDGVNRLEYTCGEEAKKFIKEQENLMDKVLGTISSISIFKPSIHAIKGSLEKDPGKTSIEIQEASKVFSVESQQLEKTIERFIDEIMKSHEILNNTRQQLSKRTKEIDEEQFFREVFKKKPETLQELCGLIFVLWKEQKKYQENIIRSMAEDKAEALMKKARDGNIFEIVSGNREELIEIVNKVINKNPSSTIVLSNQLGDIVAMSKTKDAGKILQDICNRASGHGGGTKEFAQGKAKLAKLLKVLPEYKI